MVRKAIIAFLSTGCKFGHGIPGSGTELWIHVEIELRAKHARLVATCCNMLAQPNAWCNLLFFQGKYTITHGKLVQGKSSWLFRAAWGYRKLLNWVKNLDARTKMKYKMHAHTHTPVYSDMIMIYNDTYIVII